MFFREAVRQLTTQGAACKRPSWKGYIYYNATTQAAGAGEALAEGAYQLRFKDADGTDVPMLVNSDGTDDIVVRKVADVTGVYKGTTGNVAAVVLQDYCPLTTFLLDAILNASDFEVGTTADYDAASAGANEF